MNRLIGALFIVLAGVVVLGVTFGERLPQRAPEFEAFTSDVHESIEPERIAEAKADLAGLSAAGEEFDTAVLPALAEQLGLSAAEMDAFVQSNYPAVVAGAGAIPEITTQANALLDVIIAESERFEQANAIPWEGGDARTVPAGLLIGGGILVIAGIGVLVRERWASAVALVTGAALIIVPVALSLPQKSAATDQLNEALAPVLTEANLQQASQGLEVISAMAGELTGEMLPEIADRTGVTSQELILSFAPRFPALVAAIGDLGNAILRFENILGVFNRNLANYEEIRDARLEPVAWSAIGAGAVGVLAASWVMSVTMAGMAQARPEGRRRLFRGRKAA